jgi:glycosyltransferase involved in cell wall biosynthesis
MRVAVVHNLRAGGAHRRLSEQVARLRADVAEICLATADPVTPDPIVVPHSPLAPRVARPLRPPLRYLDLRALRASWKKAGEATRYVGAEVLYANPCRFLQAPPILVDELAPSVYFCDEPRRVDVEPEAAASRNPTTRGLYARLYAAERELDRRAVRRATKLATNSRYTADQIYRAYQRSAQVLPLGVPDGFAPIGAEPRHLLSVGTLIPDKGHELVLRAAALAQRRWPVVVVAPRPDSDEAARLAGVASALGVDLELRVGIDDEALRRAYHEAFATLYLARREPYGLVALEAQACGSPVIVAAEGGLPETIVDGETGFAVEREPAAVATRVDALANPARRERMAQAAARRGASASWSRSAAAVDELLEATCASAS